MARKLENKGKTFLNQQVPMSNELVLLNKKFFRLMTQEVPARNKARFPNHAKKNLTKTNRGSRQWGTPSVTKCSKVIKTS